MITSKGSLRAAKYIVALLTMGSFTILITFGLFPSADNYTYDFSFIYNTGVVESVSMCTRFMSTPLLFLCKFIVKSLMYKGRTVVIKMSLARHVMPKRELRAFLDRRKNDQSSSRRAVTMPRR